MFNNLESFIKSFPNIKKTLNQAFPYNPGSQPIGKTRVLTKASNFGLSYLGEGASRVVFKYHNYAIKIDKESDYSKWDNSNLLEHQLWTRVSQTDLKYLMLPQLGAKKIDNEFITIYPCVETNKAGSNEFEHLCHSFLDETFSDARPHNLCKWGNGLAYIDLNAEEIPLKNIDNIITRMKETIMLSKNWTEHVEKWNEMSKKWTLD